YVDHQTKCVFNGSTLGKQYSAKAIQERCQQLVLFSKKTARGAKENQEISLQNINRKENAITSSKGDKIAEGKTKISDVGKALDQLMQPENTSDFLPYQLKRNKKRKRRRKGISNNQ